MRYAPPPRRRGPSTTTDQIRRLVHTEEAQRRARERPFDPEAPREHYASAHHFAVNPRFQAAAADDHAATELVMFIENTADLSPDGPRGQGRSILLNALRKWRKGTYEPALAVRLFEYLTETGAKRYAQEMADDPSSWSTMFTPATRRAAARQLEEAFRNSAERGEYDEVDTRIGR